MIGLTIRAFDLLKMTNKRTIRILVNRVSVNKLPLKEANSKKRSTIIDSTLDDTQNRPNKVPKLLTNSANSVISMEVSPQSQMCQNYELIDLCSSESDTSSISGSVEPFDNDYGENMPTTSSVQLSQEFISTPNLIF